MEKTGSQRSQIARGILFLILQSLVMGTIIGVGVFFISKVVYLILIFPILIGALGSSVLGIFIQKYKINKPWIGMVFGLLIGIVIYTIYHYAGYISFQNQLAGMLDEQIVLEYGVSNREATNILIDEFIYYQSGFEGFPGYMIIKANAGVSIGQLFYGSFFTLPPTLTYIYWLVEGFIIIYMAAIGARGIASKPLCKYCGDWLSPLQHLGAADLSRTNEILSLIRDGDFFAVGSLLKEDAPVPSVDLHLQGCTSCADRPYDLTVKQAEEDAGGKVQFKQVYQTTISSDQKGDLLRGIPDWE